MALSVIYKSARLTPKEVRQADADAVSKYAQATSSAVDVLQDVLEEISKLRDSREEYIKGTDILIAQIKGLGIEPAWKPPHKE